MNVMENTGNSGIFIKPGDLGGNIMGIKVAEKPFKTMNLLLRIAYYS